MRLPRPVQCDLGVARSPTFRNDTINHYNANGWALPPDPFEAHHIKPLRRGGGNDIPGTGVLPGTNEHGWFTTWWRDFSYGPW